MELIDLQTFKTKKCDKPHQMGLSSLHLECPHHHSREDKRRPPFANGKTALAYSSSYVEDFYSTQMSSNLVEYLFHPDVYKTIPCNNRFNQNYQKSDKQPQQCRARWCPYLHENQNVNRLNHLRNLPMLSPVEENYVQSIDAVNDLKLLLKGDSAQVKAKFGNEISSFKERLKQTAQISEKTAQIPAPVPLLPKIQIKSPNLPNEEKSINEWYTQYKYFNFGQKLPIIQDRYHEFKNYRDIVNNNIAPIVMKYIAAFLNSDGGVLYVGVDDNSVVYGFEMSQHEFDRFLINMDGQSKMNMLPPLMPHKYSLRRIPVLKHRRGKELWVVEVKVTPSQKQKRNKVLTTYNRQAYIRMNASTHKLDAVGLIEYLRHNEEERKDKMTGIEKVQQLILDVERGEKKVGQEEWIQMQEKVNRLSQKIEEVMKGASLKAG